MNEWGMDDSRTEGMNTEQCGDNRQEGIMFESTICQPLGVLVSIITSNPTALSERDLGDTL